MRYTEFFLYYQLNILTILLLYIYKIYIFYYMHRPKSAEIIQQTLSSFLKTPTITRWNSIYDRVKCLLKHKEKISTLCNNLAVAKLSFLNIEYLEQ